MTTIVNMENLKLDNIVVKAPRAMGKAKIVFMEPKMLVATPKLQQAWPIRPMGDESDDKFTLELKLGSGTEVFQSALSAFDMKIRKLAYENKKLWFGKEAEDITSENDLRMKQTLSIKKGNDRQDGTKWDDTMKVKVTGWSSSVAEIVYKGDGDSRMPVDIKWKTRNVDAQGRGGPDDNQTKFYICEGVDMATGKERMAPWTPCVDPAGNQVKDSSGNVVWEFVGPKHCQPGCSVRVVFNPSMVWISTKFGVTLGARQVFITPAPPQAKAVVEGIEIVETVDPIMVTRAAKQATATDELRNLDEVPNDEGEFSELLSSVNEIAASPAMSQIMDKSGEKSDKADKADKVPAKKKAKKTHDEEF